MSKLIIFIIYYKSFAFSSRSAQLQYSFRLFVFHFTHIETLIKRRCFNFLLKILFLASQYSALM